jgi:hypothetical protein
LRRQAKIEALVDFGDQQIFEGVTTYPTILTMQRGEPAQGHNLLFWKIDEMPIGSFADAFLENRASYPQDALKEGSWIFEDESARALRTKIIFGRPTLRKEYGSVFRGILTGRNEAFVIDSFTRNRVISECASSINVLKPWLDGKDVHRWLTHSRGQWLIFFPNGSTRAKYGDLSEAEAETHMAEAFPSIFRHLHPHRDACKKRYDKGEFWWELSSCKYYDVFENEKIIFRDISDRPTFSMEKKYSFTDTTTYFVNSTDWFLVSILNSKIYWFFLKAITPLGRGGFYRQKAQYIEQVPIPPAAEDQKNWLGTLAKAAQAAAEKRYDLQQSITRRIPDLAADPANAKQVEKTLKAKIPLQERNAWESWITTTRAEIHALSAEIGRLEAEINAKVYALFDLTPDEIALLEANI